MFTETYYKTNRYYNTTEAEKQFKDKINIDKPLSFYKALMAKII